MSEPVIQSNTFGSMVELIRKANRGITSFVDSVPLAVRYLLVSIALIMAFDSYFHQDLIVLVGSRVVSLDGYMAMSMAAICILVAFGVGWLSLVSGNWSCCAYVTAACGIEVAIALYLLPYRSR